MPPLKTELPAQPPLSAAAWDELHTEAGTLRPHWQPLMASLDALGRDELAIRAENSRRILREHGVSSFASDRGGEREVLWELDCIPFALSAEDWRELEAGLVQRARLLNLILGDLFGVQHLVRDGLVPAPLIYANPGYLRACQAIRVPGGNYLHLYAADVARGPEGRWWVLADRTQAPAGFGFVLENRSVLSRVLGEVLHAVRPRSLSESLPIYREALRRLAPTGADNPAIALLTPGPRNESYFEHAYVARLLGFTLVEGGDLTVRDRRVFLKTLDGLRPVDVVLRRVNDAYCDPLALRGESLLGVPGLVEATRAGQVSVANALGSGLVESPAFLPFLSGLAAHLLGEELKLPSVTTWWCGQARERRYVEAHLDELLLRPAFSTTGPQVEPGELTKEGRALWLARLSERPHEFVAQEQVRPSCAPVGNHKSRPVMKFRAAVSDNVSWITEVIHSSAREGADAILFPECVGPDKVNPKRRTPVHLSNGDGQAARFHTPHSLIGLQHQEPVTVAIGIVARRYEVRLARIGERRAFDRRKCSAARIIPPRGYRPAELRQIDLEGADRRHISDGQLSVRRPSSRDIVAGHDVMIAFMRGAVEGPIPGHHQLVLLIRDQVEPGARLEQSFDPRHLDRPGGIQGRLPIVGERPDRPTAIDLPSGAGED